MNVNYEYYRLFYYVCKYHSITRAANVLRMSQPNVTRALNRLEEQLGCKLLVRSTRGVTMTPEGEVLFAHVEIAQEQLQAGESELAGITALESGALTISASETALNVFLLDKLREFHRRYPGVRLRIANHSTPQAIRALQNMGIRVVMLTGDNARTAKAIGAQAGVDEVIAGVLPDGKEREIRRNQKVVSIKEVQLSATIEENDIQTKAKAAVKFLQGGDKVKVSIRFRGRQITHQEIGLAVMQDFVTRVKDVAVVERKPLVEGRHMIMILAPKDPSKEAKQAPKE